MSDEFLDVPLDAVREDITPAHAAQIFATEFDPVIKKVLGIMQGLGFSTAQFDDLLARATGLISQTTVIPSGMTIRQSLPYVRLSDVVVLGMLAAELFDDDTSDVIMIDGE